MRLEKGMIKDVKLGREEVVGLKLNGTYLFETTGPSYWNKYTIQIPRGKYLIATISDKDTSSRNENNYVLYVDWGIGTPVKYESGTNFAQKTYNTSGISTPYVTYTIKTTGELQLYTNSNDLSGEYVTDIASVRTDFKTGAHLFSNYSRITTIREPVLERLNTKVFTSMGSMFYNCSSMEKLNLASFDTSNVTDMYCMFCNCEKLTSLDVSHFNTDNVTNMSGMFSGCKLITLLEVSEWNTDNVTRMGALFGNCESLTSLDLSKWNTNNVKYMNGMFNGCSNLTELNLNNFDTSKIIHTGQLDPEVGGYAMSDGLDGMLENCTALRILNLANCSKDTVNDIITSKNFPTGLVNGQLRTIYCTEEASDGLTAPYGWTFSSEIPEVPVEPVIPLYEVGQFKEKYITEVVTIVNESHADLSEMFLGCTELVSVNTEDWNTSNVTNMSQMFFCCYDLPQLNLSNFNTSKVIDMSYMFSYCSSLNPLDLSSFNTGQVTNMASIFRECESLTSLDLSSFNTNLVTNMSNMFDGCTLLEELDIRNFDMSKVTSSYYRASMFANCNSLRILHLDNCSVDTISKIITSSNFPTGTINGENRIIYCTKEANNLVLPEGWEFNFIDGEPEVPVDPPTPDPEPEEPEIPLYQKGQFQGNTKLTEVVTMVNNTNSDLGYMFDGCTNLVSVNTQDWNVDSAGYMEGMFRNCSSIVNIDLSTVRYESGAYSIGAMDYMFAGCTSLETLDLRNFYISYADVEEDYITRNMFDGCTSLRTLYLNNCSAFTIDQIITRLPYGKDWGGVIYIKQYNKNDEYREIYNVAPYGWRFEYVD